MAYFLIGPFTAIATRVRQACACICLHTYRFVYAGGVLKRNKNATQARLSPASPRRTATLSVGRPAVIAPLSNLCHLPDDTDSEELDIVTCALGTEVADALTKSGVADFAHLGPSFPLPSKHPTPRN